MADGVRKERIPVFTEKEKTEVKIISIILNQSLIIKKYAIFTLKPTSYSVNIK